MMSQQNRYAIATAIPYLNARPHAGQALEFIYADVMARFQKQQGKEVVFVTGADEHGQKIANTAAKEGKEPQQFVDELVPQFQELHTALGIEYTAFVRTSSSEHKAVAQALWQKVADAGYIEKDEYEGLYCVGCEEYKQPEDLVDGKCPLHLIEPEVVRESNYFFRLARLQDEVKKVVNRDAYLFPEHRRKEMLQFLEKPAQDVSISRDVSKLSWGVPVPGDETQVMYVWFDALANYLTGTGVTPEMIVSGDVGASRWPLDSIVIGKDINRFHSILFTGMLIAAELPLPKQIVVHGHITVNGQKMSKTLGNVIDPFEMIETFGAEATRYLLLNIPDFGDGDTSLEQMKEVYASDLANGVGNLSSRVTTLIAKNYEGQVSLPEHPFAGERFITAAQTAFESWDFRAAIQQIQLVVKETDTYLEQNKPWEKVKTEPEGAKVVLEHAASNLLLIAQMLQPIMPSTARTITQTLTADRIEKITPLFQRLG